MKKDLQDKIQPIIEYFIKKLLDIEIDVREKETDLSKEIDVVKKQQDELREQEKENNKTYRTASNKLDDEINRYKNLQVSLKEEISKNIIINSNIRKLENTTRQTLTNAEAERELELEERKRTEIIRKDYENKVLSLKTDFDSLDKKQKEEKEQENKNKIKTRMLSNREEKVIESEHNLSVREIDLKRKQQRVEFVIKKAGVNV